MRVAIYARYSSENQSEKSIDDQIRVCQKYIEENDHIFDPRLVYTDEAISGAILNRPGLQALEKAIENQEIDAIAVDDLSRLSRSNHQMLTLINKFNFYQIKIISVSDGIISDDDNSKLGIHIRGLINELYLDDLKKKTMRGLEGQKLRGFSAGEKVYGYSSGPVGELRLNKKGQPKYEGMIHKITEEEAEIIRRIYKEFIEGKSINRIAQGLNIDKIPTRKMKSGGWATSTISRILKNEKYAGHWVWRKTRNVRDPMTGKKKKVARPENEHLSTFNQKLCIIDQETWNLAQKRWKEVQGAWPKTKERSSLCPQKSYVHSHPKDLFSGLLQCKMCGGAIVQVSGKSGGYYGCYNAKRKTCTNKLTIQKKRIEEILLNRLQEQFLTSENLKYIYDNIEKEIAKTCSEVPEELKQKRHQQEKIRAELQNLLAFIKAGNFSTTVSEAVKDAENRNEKLQDEIRGLEFQRTHAFKAPPREWIEFKLNNLQKTLMQNTETAALSLKNLLGKIELDPVLGRCEVENGKVVEMRAYYLAHTNIDTLALLEEGKGSNWSLLRREWDSNPRYAVNAHTLSKRAP